MSKNCVTCEFVKNQKEIISLYKDYYLKYNTVEDLSCCIVKTAFDNNLNRLTSRTTYEINVLNYCPECGKNLKEIDFESRKNK